MVQSLDHEIRPVLGHPKAIPDSGHRLVVGAVDPRKITVKLRRKGTVCSFCYVNFIPLVPGVDAQGFPGQILNQRSAKGHIDKLNALADAKHRFSRSRKSPEQ